ncbi:hypothetical protein EV702DRAFT_777507 [Suillus placidus]|uniref:Uncharacterized protein n=1 Tax=Suillus placidus TaxID=48579 RepID=A0A9P7A1M7_9AGAM|nr:hypothetical protein EV702DRAFT_777507 [Suillus placidus]
MHETPAVYFFVFPTSSAGIAFPTHTRMYADTERPFPFPFPFPTPTLPPSLTTPNPASQRRPPIPFQRTPPPPDLLPHNLALTHRATTLAHVSDPSLDLSRTYLVLFWCFLLTFFSLCIVLYCIACIRYIQELKILGEDGSIPCIRSTAT